MFSNYAFGYFEGVQKERFSNRYSGRFRIAHGKPPHTAYVAYSGQQSFSEAEAILLNVHDGDGLRLTPLILWYPCARHRDTDRDNGHCHVFDKLKGEASETTATFKATGFPCQQEFRTSDAETVDLVTQLTQFNSQDPAVGFIRDLKIVESEPAEVAI